MKTDELFHLVSQLRQLFDTLFWYSWFLLFIHNHMQILINRNFSLNHIETAFVSPFPSFVGLTCSLTFFCNCIEFVNWKFPSLNPV